MSRVVPYVFETCAGESWRLRRDHADFHQSDDVTWLVRPAWISRYGEPSDGRPEPAVELLGETEYSATDHFGNEASDVSFYAAAAILFDVPPKSARKGVAGDLP